MTVIFVLVFGRLANLLSPGDVPYPLLVIAGMVAWQVMAEWSNSVLANANLISKVYFPRIVVPASVVAIALADLALTSLMTFTLMPWYGCLPPIQVLLLSLFLFLALAAALGVGFWLSALTVRYRDDRFIVPFFGPVWSIRHAGRVQHSHNCYGICETYMPVYRPVLEISLWTLN